MITTIFFKAFLIILPLIYIGGGIFAIIREGYDSMFGVFIGFGFVVALMCFAAWPLVP